MSSESKSFDPDDSSQGGVAPTPTTVLRLRFTPEVEEEFGFKEAFVVVQQMTGPMLIGGFSTPELKPTSRLVRGQECYQLMILASQCESYVVQDAYLKYDPAATTSAGRYGFQLVDRKSPLWKNVKASRGWLN